MTEQPIRFLDDPSVALELREFMLDQARAAREEPEALSDGARRMVQGRIAASVLALPVSMKLGSLLSQGGTLSSGGVSSGAVSSGAATGSVSSVTAAAVSNAGVGIGSGVVGVASASVAPAATAGGALATTTLTVAGAKGVGLLGALSVTKGVAVLGLAVATGAGATYAVKDRVVANSEGLSSELASEGAHESARRVDRGVALRSSSVRIGQPVVASDSASSVRQQPAPDSVHSASVHSASARSASAELSLEDLEEVPRDAALQDDPTRHVSPEVGKQTALGLGYPSASERLQEEVELLRRAQQLLRTDRVLAAEALERYDVKFPQGAMRAEYDVLRRRLLSQP
jgi:hypothetical protein